jgi:preprotein translocase subunit SecA
MRLFGGDRMDRIAAMMTKYDMPADMPIQAKMVTKAVEGAQRKVEEINFAMRKNVLDYDDVMNKQRQVIYEERNKILDGKDMTEHVQEVVYDTVQRCVAEFCPEGVHRADWQLDDLRKWVRDITGRTDLPELDGCAEQGDVIDVVNDFVMECYRTKSERLGDQVMHSLTTQVMLRVIDTRWMAYLQEMDYLKTGIGLRGFGQRDPLVEYKSEAYAAFAELVNTMYEDFIRTILRIELVPAASQAAEAEPARRMSFSGPADVDGDQGSSAARQARNSAAQAAGAAPAAAEPAKPATYRKADDPDMFVGVDRNAPCPCGSGKKFKKCHGAPGGAK